MPPLIRFALLALCCLCCRPACSQVYTLPAGTVVPRPLVGLDTATYRALRVNAALDHLQLSVRAREISTWRGVHLTDSVAAVRQGAELQATRQDKAKLTVALVEQQARMRKTLALPLQRSLLLDGHFYAGVGTGAGLVLLAGLAFKSLFHL